MSLLLLMAPAALAMSTTPVSKPSVCIAGGGIGGLFTALTLKQHGYDCAVFERTSEYRPFGGPIQIASNGLAAVKQMDEELYHDILTEATCIGDRINGLKDGISNEWFATFDLKTPAEARNQKPSVVIDRPILQELLLKRVGDCVTKGVEVVGAERNDGSNQPINAIFANGEKHSCDFLVGSDGLNSKVRTVLNPEEEAPSWSGYTCFAAIAYTEPHDIKTVGYKVFLGRRKYFVSVDVGGGRIQWYAFLNVPPGGVPEDMRKGEVRVATPLSFQRRLSFWTWPTRARTRIRWLSHALACLPTLPRSHACARALILDATRSLSTPRSPGDPLTRPPPCPPSLACGVAAGRDRVPSPRV